MGCIKVRECPMGHEYEILDHSGVVSVLDRQPDDLSVACPECEAVEYVERLFSLKKATVVRPHGSGYPMFDPYLGKQVESAEHRRRLMKELNLAEIDAHDQERELDARRAAVEKERADREAQREQAQRRGHQLDGGAREAQAKYERMVAELGSVEKVVEYFQGRR